MIESIIMGAAFALLFEILIGWRRGLRRMRRELETEAAQRDQQRESQGSGYVYGYPPGVPVPTFCRYIGDPIPAGMENYTWVHGPDPAVERARTEALRAQHQARVAGQGQQWREVQPGQLGGEL